MHFVLGAPGSGKSSITEQLRSLLPEWTIVDWDALMGPAGTLAGHSIRLNEASWQPYRKLMREVVKLSPQRRTLLLGVCTPSELSDWPTGDWLVLDWNDAERVRRLRLRGETAETIQAAISDAAEYRALGLPVLDTTDQAPLAVAAEIAQRVRALPCTGSLA